MIDQIQPILNQGDHPVSRPHLEKAGALGLPGRRNEEWKFTAIDKLVKDFRLGTLKNPGKQDPFAFQEEEDRFLLHIGYPEQGKTLSKQLLPGLEIEFSEKSDQDGWEVFQENDFFPTLNRGLLPAHFLLRLDTGTKLEKPLVLKWNHPIPTFSDWECMRIRVTLGNNASLKLIEDVHEDASEGKIRNVLRELAIGEDSHLEYNHLQSFRGSLNFVGYTLVRQARNSRLVSNTFSLRGPMIRNNLYIALQGEGADCNMNGIFTPSGSMHIDNHTQVDHQVPHCTSNENYKGVLMGHGTGVFNGKIFVRQDAQKTAAFQSNKNILLSDHATIHTKPQLEIWADDVKCTHGATTGKLDQDQLFYLRSRGIGKADAEKILTKAFAWEALERITIPWFREEVENELEKIMSEPIES